MHTELVVQHGDKFPQNGIIFQNNLPVKDTMGRLFEYLPFDTIAAFKKWHALQSALIGEFPPALRTALFYKTSVRRAIKLTGLAKTPPPQFYPTAFCTGCLS